VVQRVDVAVRVRDDDEILVTPIEDVGLVDVVVAVGVDEVLVLELLLEDVVGEVVVVVDELDGVPVPVLVLVTVVVVGVTKLDEEDGVGMNPVDADEDDVDVAVELDELEELVVSYVCALAPDKTVKTVVAAINKTLDCIWYFLE
jgi:hypothetical protein